MSYKSCEGEGFYSQTNLPGLTLKVDDDKEI